MLKVLKYVVYDIMRSRMVLIYTLLMFFLCFGLFYLGSDYSSTLVSLLHVILLIVPLICIVFGTIHFYNSREFIEMLLAQPVDRNSIFFGEYLGLAGSLALSLFIGLGLPVLLWQPTEPALYLLIVGLLLTFIFTALAFLTSVRSADKAKGIGSALLLWFYFAVLFDGIVLLVLHYFNEYPLEEVVLALTALNPIDMGRVLILLKLDTSALMGYTGALYNKFFGSSFGQIFSFTVLLIWVLVPIIRARKIFSKKDL